MCWRGMGSGSFVRSGPAHLRTTIIDATIRDATVSGAGTSPVSRVRTRARRCRRRQFASGLIRCDHAGGIQHPRVTAQVCAFATDRRNSRGLLSDANVVTCSVKSDKVTIRKRRRCFSRFVTSAIILIAAG